VTAPLNASPQKLEAFSKSHKLESPSNASAERFAALNSSSPFNFLNNSFASERN